MVESVVKNRLIPLALKDCYFNARFLFVMKAGRMFTRKTMLG
jgi:hypothetical protein